MTKYNLTTEDIEYILSDDLLLKLSDSNLIVIRSKVAVFVIIKSRGIRGNNAKLLALSFIDKDYIENIKVSFKEIIESYDNGIVICGYIQGMIAGSVEFGDLSLYLF